MSEEQDSEFSIFDAVIAISPHVAEQLEEYHRWIVSTRLEDISQLVKAVDFELGGSHSNAALSMLNVRVKDPQVFSPDLKVCFFQRMLAVNYFVDQYLEKSMPGLFLTEDVEVLAVELEYAFLRDFQESQYLESNLPYPAVVLLDQGPELHVYFGYSRVENGTAHFDKLLETTLAKIQPLEEA